MKNRNTFITIKCKDDYEGRVVSTLIQTTEKISERAVIYIHGFSDYYFHDHLANEINASGIDFFAIDLRKYGRSKLTHQHDFYFKDIREYFEDITKSIEIILEKGYKRIDLMGHSTGALIISMYAFEGELKNKISALVLNSPLLNLNSLKNSKKLIFLIKFITQIFPFFKLPYIGENNISQLYNDSLHANYKGEWNYYRTIKEKGFIYLTWLLGVSKAFEILEKGLNLSLPILILHSDKSIYPKKWTEDILKSDVILNVKDMKRIGPTLGKNVTLEEIKDGIHDIYLSKLPARTAAINKTINWLKK